MPHVRLLADVLSLSARGLWPVGLSGLRVGVAVRSALSVWRRPMKRRVALATAALVLHGCAHADYGQFADSTTTAVALSRDGFAEGNPLLSHVGWPGIMAIKIVATQAVKLAPDSFCTAALTGLAGFGYGAALWNLGMLAAGSGLVGLPLAVVAVGLFGDDWHADSVVTCADPFPWWQDHPFESVGDSDESRV